MRHAKRPRTAKRVRSTAGELGIGLGPALVQQLAALHRGSIGVESGGEGSGTAFTLELPRRD